MDATAPALLPVPTHDIDLIITEEEKTIAPGFVQKVWTFGGTVPGPVIRVKVGDTIRVHLKNPLENQLAHSVDFHASQVAWNDEMTLDHSPARRSCTSGPPTTPASGCTTAARTPALHHIANGMYGMVIVEPAEGLAKVDNEFAIVQSEWYLGPQGKEADLAKAMAAAPAPDLVLFNGVANQYKDHPLEVGTGERVRIFVLNAGPEHRQLVPHRRHDLRQRHQGGRRPRSSATRATGAARPSTWRPRRAASSSSRRPRTASTRSSPTPSTSSGAARWASSRPATATRRTRLVTYGTTGA